jgi:uncharacterized protein YfiM (DUF2279 family)
MTGCVALVALLIAPPDQVLHFTFGPPPGVSSWVALPSEAPFQPASRDLTGREGPNVKCKTWSGGGDAWLAQDKLRHFTMSFASTAFAYGVARTTLDPDPAVALAGGAALAAGIGKEIHDARRGRLASPRDMAWNVAGVIVGLVFVHQIR